MKFWKHSLLAATVFLGIATTVTYTSCVHDSCKTLICRNGGTCDDEQCRCPDGWTGTQCETPRANKFVGFYDGQTKVNSLPVIIDSADVYYISGEDTPTTLETIIFSRRPEKLRGTAKDDRVYINNAPGKTITYKWLGDDKIEILIDEMVDGERKITNFSGQKRRD